MFKLFIQNFTVTQILCENKVDDCEAQNLPFFKTHFEILNLNLNFYESLQFLKVEIYQIDKIQSKETADLELLDFQKLISRKILGFPNCFQ